MYNGAIINDHFNVHKSLLKKAKDAIHTLEKYGEYYFEDDDFECSNYLLREGVRNIE